MRDDPRLDFSFSGAKTALLYRVRELGPQATHERRADLAASFQAAIVAQLAARLERALDGGGWSAVALGGGVAANGLLRSRAAAVCAARDVRLKLVARELCTDNAAMIASAARFVEPAPSASTWAGTLAHDARQSMSMVVALYGRPDCRSATRRGRRSSRSARSSLTSSCVRWTSMTTSGCSRSCSLERIRRSRSTARS